jgi:hypothetical protein
VTLTFEMGTGVCMWHYNSKGKITKSGPNIIKLKLETRLKSQASDWLKWRPGHHSSQSDVWALILVSKHSFMILGPDISNSIKTIWFQRFSAGKMPVNSPY